MKTFISGAAVPFEFRWVTMRTFSGSGSTSSGKQNWLDSPDDRVIDEESSCSSTSLFSGISDQAGRHDLTVRWVRQAWPGPSSLGKGSGTDRHFRFLTPFLLCIDQALPMIRIQIDFAVRTMKATNPTNSPVRSTAQATRWPKKLLNRTRRRWARP